MVGRGIIDRGIHTAPLNAVLLNYQKNFTHVSTVLINMFMFACSTKVTFIVRFLL
jgi:hypothetical protein